MKNTCAWPALTFIALLSMGEPVAAMVMGVPPQPGDRRFDAVGSFGFTGWLNGSRFADNWWGAATLIAPDVVLTARHNLSSNPAEWTSGNYAVRFRSQPDGTIQHKAANGVYPFLAPVRQWIVPPSGDIALRILQSPVSHIRPIPVDLGQLTVGQPITLAGWGSEAATFVGNPRNQLLLVDTTVTATGPTFVGFPSAFVSGGAATRPGPNLHDSGGAILSFDARGNPVYRGLITTLGGGTGLEQYAGTPFGALLSPVPVPVPEPASVLMLGVGLSGLLCFHWCRRGRARGE